jgi:hypothetical protein
MGDKLVTPKLTVIEFQPGRISDYGRWQRDIVQGRAQWPDILAASKSNYLEDKNLDHNLGDGAFTMPTTVALALCTTVPTDASTGATLVEADYTGYAELAIAAADLSAASGGSKTNSAALTFAACTSGSSTIIGWALKDGTSIGSGNVLYWGTATSTVISVTQTPPTVAIGGLVVTED